MNKLIEQLERDLFAGLDEPAAFDSAPVSNDEALELLRDELRDQDAQGQTGLRRGIEQAKNGLDAWVEAEELKAEQRRCEIAENRYRLASVERNKRR